MSGGSLSSINTAVAEETPGPVSLAAAKWRNANAFQQLLLVKCLRPDALLSAFQVIAVALHAYSCESVTKL